VTRVSPGEGVFARLKDLDPDALSAGMPDSGPPPDWMTQAEEGSVPLDSTPATVIAQISAALAELPMADIVAARMGDKEALAKVMLTLRASYQIRSALVAHALLTDLTTDMGRMRADAKLEVLKLVTRDAGITPKEEKGVTSAPFTLTINMGEAPPKTLVVENGAVDG
jgi:hypothetical protein